MAPLFMSVQDAYETLSDPLRRAAYDREIGEAGPAPSQPDQTASPVPRARPRHEKPEDPDEHQGPETAEPVSEREIKLRRLKIWAVTALFVGLGGYWLFQEIQLWQLVQPKGGIRLLTFQSLPAIVYAVFWAFGTLICAVADDLGTAMKAPVVCAAIAGGFAFITSTGDTGIWIPALITGCVLTFTISVAVRLRAQ